MGAPGPTILQHLVATVHLAATTVVVMVQVAAEI